MSTSTGPELAPGKAQRFSDGEAAHISQLREELPLIIEDASKASAVAIIPSIWGVPLLPGDSSIEGQRDLRVDVILHKFLKARNNDIGLARQMLVSTLKWRAEFNVAGILEEEFPEDIFGNVGYIYGQDEQGRPVTYNFYGNLDNKQVFGDLDRFLRWRVQLHERGMSKLDFVDVADMLQVHDYDGVGLFSYDKYARAASKATVQIMSDNYPETLAAKIFANVPGWGETIFNIICRWLSEETKRKFIVVSKASAPRALAERIGEANLPERFRAAGENQTQQQLEMPPSPPAESAIPSATTPDSPPSPQPAHMDHSEDVLGPTSRGSNWSDESSTSEDHAEAPQPKSSRQLPAVVTTAPELEPEPESESLANATAGMRLAEGTAAGELEKEPESRTAQI
ncbi:Non-classical phosphatidylinositol transfer protein (PITP) [Coemansia thaxteri]|uniref:Non-classical phosphatidylinositol transfer protein (PITP) n=1 Tax=Coemansia thaxteri TaxID=2663907 RepID=A0A9W8EJV2_9FUNG|nr:Non-classical phosphatidylinositol transfer protein (PITP) [Coemansia thaxteri]KAJ2004075.1 Non-classical phosphatidylinositol transfer protein (PITP) [Coemansia thaxteri]KAJ2468392.1 Non-classical phosphatidylinositol transfer protein (PITP) [Coemansia sp. RSA 2322]KAJ2484639.1 Non-classical phosphatidylinositol transfer protein (PITP) [Coemansia sp. RSA 2320]